MSWLVEPRREKTNAGVDLSRDSKRYKQADSKRTGMRATFQLLHCSLWFLRSIMALPALLSEQTET